MSKKTIDLVYGFLLALICVYVLGAVIFLSIDGCKSAHSGEDVSTVREVRDTVVMTDTVVLHQAVPVERVVVDTMIIRLTDTLTVHDTLIVEREQVEYNEPEYRAWVSGYRPVLDSIYVYPQKVFVNSIKEITPPKARQRRFGVGVQVGYGVTLRADPAFHPYIGVGLSYNLITF